MYGIAEGAPREGKAGGGLPRPQAESLCKDSYLGMRRQRGEICSYIQRRQKRKERGRGGGMHMQKGATQDENGWCPIRSGSPGNLQCGGVRVEACAAASAANGAAGEGAVRRSRAEGPATAAGRAGRVAGRRRGPPEPRPREPRQQGGPQRPQGARSSRRPRGQGGGRWSGPQEPRQGRARGGRRPRRY